HKSLILRFGGGQGVRDMGSLESALSRPYSTFDGNELYPSPIEKASAILESIINNHPFIDGNKRTGYVLCRMTLMKFRQDIDATQEEKDAVVMNVSKGLWHLDGIKEWLRKKVIIDTP